MRLREEKLNYILQEFRISEVLLDAHAVLSDVEKKGRDKAERYYEIIKLSMKCFIAKPRFFLKNSKEASLQWLINYNGADDRSFRDNTAPARRRREQFKSNSILQNTS